jgi:sigma-E factor negative regulatory protein RseB
MPLSRRSLSRVAAAIAVGLLSTAHAPAQPDAGVDEAMVDEVKHWLERMNTSVETLNYRGTFEHRVGQHVETLEIVHRSAGGEVLERISSPDGTGREILRTPHFVRSVFPDKRLVRIEEPEIASLPTAAVLHYTLGLENYYELNTFARGRIAGRDTQVVLINPRDDYRYGYMLQLDIETALPLRSEVRDDSRHRLEGIEFKEISVVDSIPDEDIALRIDTSDFEVIRPDRDNSGPASREIWAAKELPIGFTLSVYRSTLLAGSRYPVQHLVYTDGLATVSVFISHPLSEADMAEGYSRAGSTNAYALKIDGGRLAVAMGEVPQQTVHRIATSLDAR